MTERGKPALQSWIENFVGGNYVVAVNDVTVTTAPTRILQNDFERMAATVINGGVEQIWTKPSPVVDTTSGVILGEGGGNMILTAYEDLAMVGWDWWAVTSTGTSAITVVTVTHISGGTK